VHRRRTYHAQRCDDASDMIGSAIPRHCGGLCGMRVPPALSRTASVAQASRSGDAPSTTRAGSVRAAAGRCGVTPRRLRMHSVFRWPRISTATYTSRYVTPGRTGSGRLRLSSTRTVSVTPPQSRTWMRGCDANRTSRALADASSRIEGRPLGTLRADASRAARVVSAETRCVSGRAAGLGHADVSA
jgi:hypothetical protein